MSTSVIADAFRETCRARRASNAVLWLPFDRALTFDDLYAQFAAIRSAFSRHGIGEGACVVSAVGNHPVFFPLFVACMDAGAALLPLGEATDVEAAAIVQISGAACVVTDRPLAIDAAATTTLGDGVALLNLEHRHATRPYGRSLVMKLTSGSTNLPKATLAS